MAGSSRQAFIDYAFLCGRQNKTIVKKLYVASDAASEAFRFKPISKMADHGSAEKDINWIDGHIEYSELHTVLNKAVAGFAHLYAYGVSNCTFLAGMTGRPIHNLEDINCHPPDSFNHERWFTLLCHKFSRFSCATINAQSPYECFMYYLQKNDFAQCPADMTRHTADFVTAL